MPEKIHINKELGIIEVESTGNISMEDVFNSFAKGEKILEETGINKVLVNTTGLDRAPDTFSSFKMINSMRLIFKVAFLTRSENPSAEMVRFVETLSINRGGIIKVFTDRERAIEWLLDKA